MAFSILNLQPLATGSMNKKQRSTVLQIIIFLALAATLIYWQYNAMDEAQRRQMMEAMAGVRWIYAVPVLLVGFLSHYFRAMRWRLLMRPLDINTDKANTLFSVLIGYLVNALVPRLGEVAKCTILAKYEKVPADKMVGTILAERAFDMVCLFVIFGITFLTQYSVISPFAMEMYHKAFFDAAGNFIWLRIVIAAAVLIIGLIAFIFLYKKIKHTKAGGIIKSIGQGLQTVARIKEKGQFLFFTVMIWVMYIAMAVLGFYALPGTDSLPILAGLSVMAFGSIAMIITPGGVGAFPPIVASILFLYGIDLPVGTAYGWVSWAAQTGVVLILGLASLILLPIYNRNKNGQQATINRK